MLSLVPCLVQVAATVLSLVSTLVRFTLISDVGQPKSAYLTVHTIVIQSVYGSLGSCDCLLRATTVSPPRLTAMSHGWDALVVAQGLLLFVSYYGLSA